MSVFFLCLKSVTNKSSSHSPHNYAAIVTHRHLNEYEASSEKNKIFATLVCGEGGGVVANSDVSYTTISNDDDDEIVVTISQAFFVSTSELDTDICNWYLNKLVYTV